MSAGRDGLGDLGEVKAHALARAAREHETGSLALRRADGAEDVGRLRSLILGRRGPGAALGPAPGDLVLLPDASLVGEPEFYRLAVGFGGCDRRQTSAELFLKTATAASSFA